MAAACHKFGWNAGPFQRIDSISDGGRIFLWTGHGSIVYFGHANHPDLLVLDFTERSYDLTGKTNVFSRTVDSKGKRIRFIRNLINAKFMPGLPEQYIPFAPNWIVRGYIVKDNGISKFDFKSLVGIDGYTMDVLHPEDD